jgi:DedD protein
MMDRRVKERLVGATILVALIVLVVPELLSGPKPSSAPPLEQGLPATTREVDVDLATSRATPEPSAASAPPAPSQGAQAGSATGTEAAAEARQQGAPVGDAGAPPRASNEAAAPPTVATLRAQESPATLETAPPTPRSTPAESKSAAPLAEGSERRSAWAVQLGSFASKVNANKLVRQLQGSAIASVYVVSSGSGSSLRYRVRMGPMADRTSAQRAVAKLKAQGHPATIVTPSS